MVSLAPYMRHPAHGECARPAFAPPIKERIEQGVVLDSRQAIKGFQTLLHQPVDDGISPVITEETGMVVPVNDSLIRHVEKVQNRADVLRRRVF
jgi:hypothetical protein